MGCLDKYLAVSEDIDMGKRIITHIFAVIVISCGLGALYGGVHVTCDEEYGTGGGSDAGQNCATDVARGEEACRTNYESCTDSMGDSDFKNMKYCMCTKMGQDRFAGCILRTMPYLVTLFLAIYLGCSGKMKELEISWIDIFFCTGFNIIRITATVFSLIWLIMANTGGTCGSQCASEYDLGTAADAMVYVLYVLSALEIIAGGVYWYMSRNKDSDAGTFG